MNIYLKKGKRFAQLTANIFLRANVPVYLFRDINPTPFVVSRYKNEN